MLLTALIWSLAGSGCGGGGSAGEGTPAPVEPPAPSLQDDYFGDTAFIGRTVSVTGIVIRVITPTSFVLDVTAMGDQSVLVLSAPSREVTVNYRVTVSGEVRKFDYRAYADDYALAPDPGDYRAFAGRQFLVAATPQGLNS